MQLFYRTYGKGQPFVILHGLYGMSDNWVTHAKLLGENYQVYIPDLRNHGQSEHSELFDYNLMAEDIAEFIKMHNLENPIIMGHSMGGKVAMRFALDNPNKVSKLIVVDMSMRSYKQTDFNYQLIYALLDIDFAKTKTRKEIEDKLDQTIQNQRIRMFLMKNIYWTEQKKLSWRFNLKAIFDNIDAVFEGIKSTQQFDKPSLFIRGGESDYVSDEDFMQIQKNFPQAILKIIPKAGHWVQADESIAFMDCLSDFLI
jgi:pimeloyl-ACP methyl ester carboxylesterase